MKLASALLFLVFAPFLSGAPLSVDDLRIDLKTTPAGVGTAPHFSWKLVSEERGKRQSAYQILAATSPEKLTEKDSDLWNSSKQGTGSRNYLPWKGKDLAGTDKVYWKVRVWDEQDEAGPWSKPTHFQVAGEPSLPKPSRTSSFESSSAALNKLYHDSVKELEKRLVAFAEGDSSALGKGARVHRSARSMLYHFDAVPHLTEWVRLMDDSLTANKTFPILPGSSKVGSVSSEAAITVSHPLWWMGGDSTIPKTRWTLFEDHMVFRRKNDPAFKGTAWGDAAGSEGMSAEFLDLAFLGFTTRLIRELAGPAEQPLNVVRFQDFAARIRKSFERNYLKEGGSLKASSQTAHVLALRSAVLTPEQQEKVTDDLMASISKNGVQVGPIGAYFLPPVLTLTGHQDEAVKLLANLTPEQQETFTGNGVSEWLMAYLAGLDAGIPGFRQLVFAPRIPSDGSVTWVKARYEALTGTAAIHWQVRESGSLKVEITVPAGTVARIILPAREGAKITEGGQNIDESSAVTILNKSDDLISLISQSGTYSFLIE